MIPVYAIRNPAGETMGTSESPPISAAAWSTGARDVLTAAAKTAAPGIASLLGRIEAAAKQSDPNSLLNPARPVWFTGVTGAPGDGNTSLVTQMRAKLGALGLVLQDDARGADYSLAGTVDAVPGASGTVRIEVQWIVSDGQGERGRILQLNEVPPATVNRYWGDVAVAVASEAAGGVRDVILNATGARRPAKPDA